ncbi:hypothetical protein ACFXMF_33450, partial [Embleya sp. NPDC059213]
LRPRVALARALAARPDILLADEITSALDAETAAALLDLVDGLRTDGLAVLMATHDPDIAARADRVLRLTGGALVEDTPDRHAPIDARDAPDTPDSPDTPTAPEPGALPDRPGPDRPGPDRPGPDSPHRPEGDT